MADSKQIGEGWFITRGTVKELHDGSLYVVTENGYLEDMIEVRYEQLERGQDDDNGVHGHGLGLVSKVRDME